MKKQFYAQCQEHPNQLYEFIDLRKDSKSRLACPECLYFYQNNTQLTEYIPLRKAFRYPNELLIKLLKPHKNHCEYLNQMFAVCDEDLDKIFEQQDNRFSELDNIFKQIKQQLLQQRNNLKDIQKALQKERKDFLISLKFDEMTFCLEKLTDLEDEIQSQKYSDQISKFSKLINEVQENNCEFIVELVNEIKAKQMKMSQSLHLSDIQLYNNKFEHQMQQYKSFIDKKYSDYFPAMKNLPQSKIIYQSFFRHLIGVVNELQKKQISNVQLIYLGSRDGLGSSQFWSKVYDRSNLLMVFKSNNNTIFGGYSPCKWWYNTQQIKNNTGQVGYFYETVVTNGFSDDYEVSSFLFNQADYAIYRLRNYTQSINRQNTQGPIFGNDDLKITANFQGCSSKLGESYKFDKTDPKRENILLGSQRANIIECEIYQLS